MCGIYSILSDRPLRKSEIVNMSQLISHRGPDDEAVCFFGKNIDNEDKDILFLNKDRISSFPDEIINASLALGHRRLSIIELSEAGRQPMSYLSEKYWIIFNGEVYNYLELAKELKDKGVEITTNTDTEIILAAYHYYGKNCLNKFNGMWAFIIYDKDREELFIARDRFGVKPLYYRVGNGTVAFSSEIKAFMALTDWEFSVNASRLVDYLVWTIQDHTNETFFEDIFQIPAGSCLTISLASFSSLTNSTRKNLFNNIEQWYDISKKKLVPNNSESENAIELKKLINSSIDLRLRSDVEVGSCLSGGIDSSVITSFIGGKVSNSNKFKTITAGSSYEKYDERKFSRMVVNKFGFKGVEQIIDEKDLFDNLKQLIWFQDEPFATTSVFAQWNVFKTAANEGVKVMLDGQGADEIFCGYPGFYGPFLAGLIKKFAFKSYLINVVTLYKKNKISLPKILGYTIGYLFPQFFRIISKYDNKAYGDLTWVNKTYQAYAKKDPLKYFGAREGTISSMSLAQIKHTNLPMLLHWEDRNSMAFSIEARVPFLDYRIVEFAINNKDEYKINYGITKKVLRNAAEGIVPEEILERRDKMGFLTAEPEWMKNEMKHTFREHLVKAVKELEGYVNEKVINMYDDFINGERGYSTLYWRVICAGKWIEVFKKKE